MESRSTGFDRRSGKPVTLTGKQYLAEILSGLQEELENYFGQQTEIREGLKPEPPIILKPIELIRYEMVKETGLHLWEGGLQDQPHIWLLQYRVVDNVYKTIRNLWDINDRAKEKQRNANQPT